MTDVRAQEEVSLRNLYTDTHACTRLQHHLSHCDPRHMLIAFAAIVIHTSQSHLDNLSHSNHVALRPGGKPEQKKTSSPTCFGLPALPWQSAPCLHYAADSIIILRLLNWVRSGYFIHSVGT